MPVPGCFPFLFQRIHLRDVRCPIGPNRTMAASPLDQLKQTLGDQGLYNPPKGDSPASHDDATLLSVLLPFSFGTR
jgi:hypothetical protein